MADDSTYVCTLDEKSLVKAKDELNEDPKDRLAAVKALREWVEAQPHIKARTDTEFLLQILRTKKFSQLESRKMIENLLKIRLIEPKWFLDLDSAAPGIQKAIGTGFMVPLPGRDDEGRKVLLIRRAQISPDAKDYNPVDDVIRAQIIVGAFVNDDENVIVNGTVSLNDMTGFTMRHHTMMPMDSMRRMMKAWVGNVPGRFKAFHMYNVGSFLEFFMNFAKSFLPKKYTQRMILHGDNLESVYKHIPLRLLPLEYLPDDYEGPNAGPIKDLIVKVQKDVQEKAFREKILEGSSKKYGIDESKMPKEEPQASFRKLNID